MPRRTADHLWTLAYASLLTAWFALWLHASVTLPILHHLRDSLPAVALAAARIASSIPRN
jgi:hypothetical protein